MVYEEERENQKHPDTKEKSINERNEAKKAII